ncbi:hypothetical protein BKA58DRAFT_459381 [Alternaria rosae]|uniref:uncharacterized protein n=1 Tax=Alternaria rosae TaxID=1187941 RepID=UPI001E8DB775|nr:uncharacterized protein BKA58DRAFT_459381 [Alternaria rosae]KAH6868517.1 hypothetical protein BKA58DRAFT_459381 [Alternaria rosae]
MRNLKIAFNGHRSIPIDRRTLSAWLPQLSWIQRMDGDDLVDELESRIQDRYGISRHHIERTLSELFRRLGQHSGFDERQTQMRLVHDLSNLLMIDSRTVSHSRGLRSSRYMFIILSYLAAEQGSVLLAEALYYFWLQDQYLISQESSAYDEDWVKALAKVREAMEGPATMNFEPFAMVPHAGWHRGRSARALAPPWRGHRARSLPVIRRRHSPDMRLAIPTHPSSGWASPMISPVRYPRGDYFNELQNLQWQQSEMNMQLSSVDGKLDFLLAGGIY